MAVYQIMGSDFQATLRAIATAGKAEVLSRPSMLARDGQPATILVGQQVPLITGVSYTAVGNSTIPINNVTYHARRDSAERHAVHLAGQSMWK